MWAASSIWWGTYYARARCALGRNRDFHVKKVEEYLEHASECRALARAAPQGHRQQLEDMAQTWEQLVEARKREIKKQLKAKYARTTLGVDVPVGD
jgi:DNA-binding transcriptional MerR regulator